MKIFIDTANVDEIKEIASWGILDGVTTNPTLLSKEIKRTKRKPEEILKEICDIVKGPVSAEVIALDWEGIVKQGKELAKISEYITIKVPMTKDGLKATKILRSEGIMTNMTLVFSANQAILAAKAGTTFVSPFIGRLDDIGNEGMTIIEEIMDIYENYGYETEVIVASIRHPIHIVQAGRIGADIVTVPYNVLEKMIQHPLTDIGIERFLKDWKEVQNDK
uniref:Probable transaldolase n=1 Tax=candidate division WOR-3 bacterium TaxID=2052148 RepID=A0A7C4YH29_UNCW3